MEHASDTATIELSAPIEAGGVRTERVTLRRPLVRDLRAAARAAGRAAGDGEIEFRLFVNLCEVTPETLDAMAMADYLELQEAYRRFLSRPSISGPPASS